jgi:hypothetical protein
LSELETKYENQVKILSELWIEYRNDTNFVDFVEYNDLGLPLAYAIDNAIVESTDMAANFITETFALLLEALDIEEDTGFESLDNLLEGAGEWV